MAGHLTEAGEAAGKLGELSEATGAAGKVSSGVGRAVEHPLHFESTASSGIQEGAHARLPKPT